MTNVLFDRYGIVQLSARPHTMYCFVLLCIFLYLLLGPAGPLLAGRGGLAAADCWPGRRPGRVRHDYVMAGQSAAY